MLQPLVLLVVGLLIVFLLVVWVIAFIRKVGGCLIHLMLVAAALLLFGYLGWFFWQRFLQG
jgi:hypothetical protein